MSPDEWQEIDSLVQAAFERTPDERAAFLAEACAGRPELHREVSALIQADAAAQTFLDKPAGENLPSLDIPSLDIPSLDIPSLDIPGLDDSSSAQGPRPQAGELFGPYRLLEEVGYGGFCRVYRGEHVDQGFSRQVAVKIVDPGLDYGFGDDTGGDIAERFRRERQILAQLDHPSIARLYDGGEVGGRPYFVMEYVDGEPIDVHCRRARLGLEARLRLVLRVIDAVAYAHEHLIVHRDLKPGNLLVTSDGQPKLLDFGIAKALEPEALALSFDATRSGLRPMTPAWAAPEQVRGEAVTTATDVYGLGLLLYYLLTGERAYELDEMTPSQMENAICDLEPPPPSRRLDAPAPERPADATPPRLEGDLDAIVMTALAKDPRRRYRTVRGLGEDLERFLRREPVTARPATRLYRTGKWLQRHRWAATAALSAALVLTAFISALVLQSERLAAERDLARQESSRAEEVSRFLVEIFAEADPGRTQGRDLSVRRILDEGRRKIDRLDEPAARTELLQTLGSVHAGLGDVQQGTELLRRARREAVSLYGEEHERVAEIDHRLGEVLTARDLFSEAEAAIRSALDLRRRVLGEDHVDTAESLALLGRLRSYQGFWGEAEEILGRAVGRLEAAGPAGEKAMIDFLGDLASARSLTGRGESGPLLERRLRLAKQKLGERHPLAVNTLTRLAFSKEDHAERVAGLEHVLELQEDIYGPDHPRQAAVSRGLAWQLLWSDPRRALELARRALVIDERVWGDGTWSLSLDHAVLAGAYDGLDEIEKADEHWRLALEDARQGAPETHTWRAQILIHRLAFLLGREKELTRLEESEPLEEAELLLAELKSVRAGLAHRLEKWDVLPFALEALLDVRRGDENAVPRLRRHGEKAIEALGDQSALGRVLRRALDELESSGV